MSSLGGGSDATAAFFVFSAAAANAGVVAVGFGFAFGLHILHAGILHDGGWGAPFFEFICHVSHVGVDMFEEVFVSGAEVV